MGDDGSNVTFNINTATGHNEFVGRDKIVYGGQNTVIGSPEEVRAALAELRALVPQAGLPPEVAAEAGALLDDADAELSQPEPKEPKVAGPVQRFTELLSDAGALASSGAALIGPLTKIGHALGAAGGVILALL